jgi:hypothetical protein
MHTFWPHIATTTKYGFPFFGKLCRTVFGLHFDDYYVRDCRKFHNNITTSRISKMALILIKPLENMCLNFKNKMASPKSEISEASKLFEN